MNAGRAREVGNVLALGGGGYFAGMTVLRAHFDGKVIVPDEPVNLPQNCALKVQVEAIGEDLEKPLQRLVELAKSFPAKGMPSDAAEQHDLIYMAFPSGHDFPGYWFGRDRQFHHESRRAIC